MAFALPGSCELLFPPKGGVASPAGSGKHRIPEVFSVEKKLKVIDSTHPANTAKATTKP